MRLRTLPLLTLIAGAIAPLTLIAGADGATRLPKLTSYPATLDVAGYVHVRRHHDDTTNCGPGRDFVIAYDASVELGRPRRVRMSIMDGIVTSTFAVNPGGAIHRGEVTSYRETNWCPPTKPEVLGKPACVRTGTTGALRAFLTPTPVLGVGPDDPTPLGRSVSIELMRRGGGHQTSACLNYLSTLEPSVGPHVLTTLEISGAAIIVPLGVSQWSFLALKKGKAIRRSIRLNGACDHVLISAGAASASTADSCTVTGRIYVSLKRTG